MAASSNILEVSGPTPELSFRINLLFQDNPDVVKNILAVLPLRSLLLHVVVAGETIYMPAPSISLASKNMVERRMGTVYYNTTSQSICICYGAVTESTPVNQFAQVVEEDFPKLAELGKLVYEQTVSIRLPTIIETIIRKPGDNPLQPLERSLPSHGKFDGSWQSAKETIDDEIASLRVPEEPDEIRSIRLGATRARAGSEGSSMQTIIFLQGFLSTLGPHIFSRLLTISTYKEMTLPLMIRQTRAFLTETFNHFEFLADLGLGKMSKLGDMYSEALDTLTTMEDYRQLTDSMRTLIQLLYRWLHLIFPWYLKDQFQSRRPEDVSSMPKLKKYSS